MRRKGVSDNNHRGNVTGKDVQCNNQPVATIATASALATAWHSAVSRNNGRSKQE